MRYAKLILESLLLEEAREIDVIDAIKKKYEVYITYDPKDNKPEGKGERVIQPVAYGKTTKGRMALRAFQPEGDTESSVPRWKMFALDSIIEWRPNKEKHFSKPPMYNENGDNSFTEVYVISKFDNEYEPEVYAKRTSRSKSNNSNDNGDELSNVTKQLKDYNKDKSKNIRKRRNNNSSSINDMSRIKINTDFNNNPTVGPVTKNNNETESEDENANSRNYDYAKENGTVVKSANNYNGEEDKDIKDNGYEQIRGDNDSSESIDER